MYKNFKYFRRLISKKEPLNRTNINYLTEFAKREIKEWQEFIKDIKNI